MVRRWILTGSVGRMRLAGLGLAGGPRAGQAEAKARRAGPVRKAT